MTENSNSNPTQAELIREHLEEGRTITSLEALYQYGCLRLAARIKELKQLGLAIHRNMIKENGKCYAEYSIENSEFHSTTRYAKTAELNNQKR